MCETSLISILNFKFPSCLRNQLHRSTPFECQPFHVRHKHMLFDSKIIPFNKKKTKLATHYCHSKCHDKFFIQITPQTHDKNLVHSTWWFGWIWFGVLDILPHFSLALHIQYTKLYGMWIESVMFRKLVNGRVCKFKDDGYFPQFSVQFFLFFHSFRSFDWWWFQIGNSFYVFQRT